MQTTFFDTPSTRERRYNVYHDESGTDRAHARFLVQGVLFVPQDKVQWALKLLTTARGSYSGRIHFVDLRDKTSSLKGQAAWAWMNLFFNSLSDSCPFKATVADTASPLPQITRFSKPCLLYNHTTVMAIRGGIVWSLNNLDRIHLAIYSEQTSRAPDDNFASYVPSEVAKRTNFRKPGAAKCPEVVEPVPHIHLVEGDPTKVHPSEADHCEFIQLSDLLTSAVSQALNASSSQTIKIDLARFVAGWIDDTRLPPWTQELDLHRRFSVSCFPSSTGGFFDVPLSVTTKGQLSFRGAKE